MMSDLTVKKMLETLRMVDGSMPDRQFLKDNEFITHSKLQKIDVAGFEKLKELGYDDFTIFFGTTPQFTFIWKKEKK